MRHVTNMIETCHVTHVTHLEVHKAEERPFALARAK